MLRPYPATEKLYLRSIISLAWFCFGGRAKHLDIKILVYPNHLSPKCFAPTDSGVTDNFYAVAKRLNGEGFLITAYPTDAIKEGEQIWVK